MEEVNCNDNWRNSSYWEEFQVNNPEKATEVIALGIDPDTLSDKDVKEVIFAIEIEAKKLNCSILFCSCVSNLFIALFLLLDSHALTCISNRLL